MLEQSVFTNEKIIKEIYDQYGLKIDGIEKINRGSANIYKLSTSDGYYILKEFQSKYSKEDIDREISVVKHLAADNINVPQYIKLKNGEYSYVYGEKVIILQKFIEGEELNPNTCNKEQLKEAAVLLAKIVKSLKNFEGLPKENVSKWVDSKKIDDAIEQFKVLIEDVKGKEEEDKISKDLKDKIKMLSDVKSKIDNDIFKISHKNSHGDYNLLQFLYKNEKINAVIDFASARELPIVWEIIRSYSYMDKECNDGKFNVENLVEYTREYMKYEELTEYDLKYMPYVYLVQILRSSYGYKQYINSGNKELLNFGYYRTNIARYLFENAEEISNRLLKIII